MTYSSCICKFRHGKSWETGAFNWTMGLTGQKYFNTEISNVMIDTEY